MRDAGALMLAGALVIAFGVVVATAVSMIVHGIRYREWMVSAIGLAVLLGIVGAVVSSAAP